MLNSFEDFSKFVLQNSSHNTRESDRVHIILNYPKIEWDEYAQYMATLTWWTGVGWGRKGNTEPLIFAETLDEAVAQADKYDYAMVSYIGTFYNNWNRDSSVTIHTHFNEFCDSGAPCKGHILWHEKNAYARMHLQCFFLNLDHWRLIGKPSFGKYSGEVIWPDRSASNVHDDYTPYWLSPPEEPIVKNVRSAEMAEYISKVIESGHTIYNFVNEREVKFFCYPERRQCEALEFEENKEDNIVYTRNNEKYSAMKVDTNLKFDVIYAPSSGFSGEYLYHLYGHENTKMVFFDINKDSISWKKMVYDFRDIDRIEHYWKSKDHVIVDDADYKPVVRDLNEELFPRELLEETMNKIGTPEFIEFDAVIDPIENLNIDTDKVNLLYFSNIFCYNYLIHRHPVDVIHSRWNEYLDIDNCIIGGKNLFRDEVIHGNY